MKPLIGVDAESRVRLAGEPHAVTRTALTGEPENAGAGVPGTLPRTGGVLGHRWRDGLAPGTTRTGDLHRD